MSRRPKGPAPSAAAPATPPPEYLSSGMTADAILQGMDRGDTVALARAISLVENQRDGFERLLARIHPRVGHARRIGITGPPGAGKSTLTERLVREIGRASCRERVWIPV